MSHHWIAERPPLHVTLDVETPARRYYRWAHDDPRAENVPSGLRWSSTMPGGYETLDVTLPRRPGVDYGDLERLSTITVRDAGGGIAGEYRLERTPRTSGDQMAVSPSAVGWQAHLEDDKSAREIYVDRDAGSWSGPSIARRDTITGLAWSMNGGYDFAGAPGLSFNGAANVSIPINANAEAWYAAPAGVTAAKFGYQGTQANTTNVEAATLYHDDNDSAASPTSQALTLDDTVRTATLAAAERYLMLRAHATATHTPAAGSPFSRTYEKVAVYGNHGLTLRAVSGELSGLYASDIVTDAVARWAPLLTTATDSIQASQFVIPHAVFRDPTTAGEIIRHVTRYGFEDWAVWAKRTFYWHARGLFARNWRARVGPAGLEETGPQVDRLWESVIVSYQDVDGSTRTVGPPGSGADTEDAALKDDDPDNPANQLGIKRRDLLQMGIATAASATEVGRRFLEETKALDTSGRARIVGYVQDDRGITHPYHAIRAGDTLEFPDASDPSPRRVVRAEHDDSEAACTVDLDAPPEGLAALLERLGVVLIPLGL